MKKLLILLIGCLILGTVAAEAQIANAVIIGRIKPEKKKKEKKPRPEYGFEQSVDLSFNLGQSKLTEGHDDAYYHSTETLKPKATIMANWVGGRRFNDRFFLGGGVGLGYALADEEYSSRYNRDGEWHSNSNGGDYNTMMMNIFSQARFYMGGKKYKTRPFVALSLGCSIDPCEEWQHYTESCATFMINPEVGLNYRVKDHLSFYFNLGYVHAFTDGVQLKLGVTF